MCLGIPGKVVETWQQHHILMGRVDFGGVFKQVCLEHVAEAQPGSYVIVHAGFGLSVVDEDEARQIFAFLEQMDELEELQEAEQRPAAAEVKAAEAKAGDSPEPPGDEGQPA